MMTPLARVSAVVESAKDGSSLDGNASGCARGVVAGKGKKLPGYPDALPEGSDRLHFPGAREQKFG
jgi:hypothetical protein